MLPFVVTLLALALAMPFDERRPEAELDLITLLDGSTHRGQVVYQDEEIVVLRNNSREKVFPRAEVEDVDSRVANLWRLLQRLDDAGPQSRLTVDEWLEMASFAEHSRLPGEARMLRLMALLKDPDNEGVNELLGNKRRQRSWTLKRGRRWLRTDELDQPDNDWKDRWQLDTAHYRVETNLPLSDAIAAIFDIERLYRAVFELISGEVGLREPQDFMELRLHADEASFPEPGSGRRGEFVVQDRIAYVDVSSRPWQEQLVHEATRQLLFYTTQRAVNAKGELPRWLDTGLADSFALGLSGRPGRLRFDPLSADLLRYRLHALARRPFELRRVLTFDDVEMDTHELQGLRYAECYTLVQYLLQGDAGEHTEAFFDFLRASWQGKASPSLFEELMGRDIDGLQQSWLAAVKRVAGV